MTGIIPDDNTQKAAAFCGNQVLRQSEAGAHILHFNRCDVLISQPQLLNVNACSGARGGCGRHRGAGPDSGPGLPRRCPVS